MTNSLLILGAIKEAPNPDMWLPCKDLRHQKVSEMRSIRRLRTTRPATLELGTPTQLDHEEGVKCASYMKKENCCSERGIMKFD